MKNKKKKWYKKWQVWLIVVIILIGISATQGETDNIDNNQTQNTEQTQNTLPQISANDYVGQESLLVYHELKNKGYTIELDYAIKDNQKLYENNMKLLETFKDLDPNNEEDRASVDAYIIDSIIQDKNNVKLIIK